VAKRKSKQKSRGGSEVFIIIGLGAVIVVLGLIVLGGGFAAPTAAPTEDSLQLCNGAPCPAKGSPDAPVVVIEFSDYACNNCRDFNLFTAPILDREYVETGKIRYVSHVFALWPESQPAAAAALCAEDQGKYWELHAQAFAGFREDGFPIREDFLLWGQQAGLDAAAFQECVDSGRRVYDAQVASLEGQRAGITGTPTFFVNGTLLYGNVSIDRFRQTIDLALTTRQ
jgi:protein-disulfide isomerase